MVVIDRAAEMAELRRIFLMPTHSREAALAAYLYRCREAVVEFAFRELRGATEYQRLYQGEWPPAEGDAE